MVSERGYDTLTAIGENQMMQNTLAAIGENQIGTSLDLAIIAAPPEPPLSSPE